MTSVAPRPRTPLQTAIFRGLIVLFVLFGAVTVYRTAFLSRKMGDLDCYLRAGWAIRAGVNPYDIVCDNDWHYNYPPPYAILMAPLADPPAFDSATLVSRVLGAASSGTGAGAFQSAAALAVCPNPMPPDVGWCVPFAVSAGICYLLNVLALVLGIHLLASALERAQTRRQGEEETRRQGDKETEPGLSPCLPISSSPCLPISSSPCLPTDGERWWGLRLVPICVGLVPLGQTLIRGQVNTLVLLLVCAMLAALLDRRCFRAGLYLAGAIALKIIPGYLLLLPLWLRPTPLTRRCLAGTAVGLVLWLGLFPLLTIGPARTLACYERLAQATVGPALRLGGDASRHDELINTTATDNQSFGAVLHNLLHPDRASRPHEAEAWTRKVHWGFAALLALATLLAAGRGPLSPGRLTLLGGALTTLMILSSPVCHLHYLMLTMPLCMGLLAVSWERGGWRGPALGPVPFAALAVFALGLIVPVLPGLEVTRDLGLATALGLLAWGWAVVELARRPAPSNSATALPGTARAA